MSMWQLPAVVALLVAWLSTPPATLGEVARREAIRRDLIAAPAHVYTNQDLPAESTAAPPPAPAAVTPPATPPDEELPQKPATTPAEAAASAQAPPSAAVRHDEAWWRDRITRARDAVVNDELLAEAVQSRINALTSDWINRDDPVQKAQLFEQRQKALEQLDAQNKKIEADKQAVQAVLDDAKQN